MKKFRFLIAALCCMFVSVNVFAAPSAVLQPEEIQGRNAKIYKYSLKNGIPVYYVENKENAVDEVSIVVKGGRVTLKPEQSGLENALFTMMSLGSSHYSYQKRQQIKYEKSVDVSLEALDEATVLSLSCLNYYMDEMLPILTDSFMNPTFTKPVYDNMMTVFTQQVQATLNNPWSLLKYKMKEVSYKGHCFEADKNPTEESLKNITIDEMKKWHKSILDSRRIFVVAVTSKNPETIVNTLNSSIGTIKKQNTELQNVKIDEVNISGDTIVMTHPAATGSGYAARFFQTPLSSSDDYLAGVLASSIYTKIMYSIVRTKNGVCYSTGSDSESSEGIGSEYLYMLSDFNNFAKYLKEARNIMASGKYVEKLNEDGTYVFAPISRMLPGAKNTLISSVYDGTTKTNGRVMQYISGIVYYDDITAYDTFVEKIHEITTQDILRVFKKYWVDQPARWIAVVGPELENVVSFEE